MSEPLGPYAGPPEHLRGKGFDIVEAEALRVGPDEVLVLHFLDDLTPGQEARLRLALSRCGLGERFLVVTGDLDMAVVAR